ncbi:MAG: hypothetical protein HC912_11775 [Saprospiraceae bacterium]|nr:hypothetical protein [Saprospiraceae bacterium]
MNPIARAYIELHTAVFLFGFTAILGDLISLSAISLVWWRVLITCASLFFFIRIGQLGKTYSRKIGAVHGYWRTCGLTLDCFLRGY